MPRHPTTEPPNTPRRLPHLSLLAAAALASTLLVAHLLWMARADTIRSAQTTALNHARTLEARLEATLRRSDAVLQAMARSTPLQALLPGAEAEHAERLNGELAALTRAFDELIALRILDASGEQRYASTETPMVSVNYSDRAYFQRYLRDREAQLTFSEVLTGRLTGRPTMVIAYPLREPGGELAGMVVAALDLSLFQQQFAQLDVGRQGSVSLRRTDQAGALVLRWPHLEAEVNRPLPEHHPVLRHLASGKSELLDEYRAHTDGVQRMSGSVLVRGHPFFLTVAVSREEALRGWRRMAWSSGLLWLGLLAAMAVLVRRTQQAERARIGLERQLLEARRIEALGTLAGGIAHDFNNILAAIIGNAALARQALPDGHPAVASLGQVRTASLRGRTLVQQILAIGRRQPQALVSQALLPVVEETVGLLRPTLPAGVQLQVLAGPAPVHAAIDAARFHQVLMNLCTNASHAMRGRPGVIQIGLEALPHPGRVLREGHTLAAGPVAHLWVHDEGAGMDAATLARIFEPFFTTKPVGEGTGLGLAVVQGVVAAHGGDIVLDSAPGQGTTAHIYLPLTPAPADEPAPADHRAEAAPAGPAPDGHRQRVLYVDDDSVVALMVEQLLGQAGCTVEVLHSGPQALARLRADPQAFDVVVTDFNMPGLSGLDVAREVAALRPGLPVCITSGYITEALLAQAREAGVRAVLQKQNTLEELLPLLRRLAADNAREMP